MSLLSHLLLLRSRCYCISGRGTRRGSLRVHEGLPSPQSNVVGDFACRSSSSSREGWRSSWSVGSRTAAAHSSGLCCSSLKPSPTVTAAAALAAKKKKKRRKDKTNAESLDVAAFFPPAAGCVGSAAAYVLGIGNIKVSASPTYVPCAFLRSRAAAGSAAAAASVSVSKATAGALSAAAFSTAAASSSAASAAAAAVVRGGGGAAAEPQEGGRWSSETFDGTEKESPSFRAACAAMLLTLSLSSSSSNNIDSSNSRSSSSSVRIFYEGRSQKPSKRSASALLQRTDEEKEDGVLGSCSRVIARRISPAQCCSSSAASVGHSTYMAPAEASRLTTSFPSAVVSLEKPSISSNPAAAASAAASSVAAASSALVELKSCAASISTSLDAVSAAAAAEPTAAAVAAGELAANVSPSVAGPLLLFSDASVVCGGAARPPYAAEAAAAAQPLSPAAVAGSSSPAAAAPASQSAAAAAGATLAAQPASSTFTISGRAADSIITAAAAATFPAAASSRALYQELTADSPLQLFSGAAHPELAREIAAHLNVSLGRVQLGRFLDGECLVRVLDEVRGRDVFVIQSVPAAGGDLHSSLVELFLLITTLRRASAKRVTAVMPYFPYCRETELKGQRNDICTPMAAADLAVLLQVCGADAAIFVDVHNPRIEGFFTLTGEPPIPMSNIDPHGLAVQYLQKKDLVKPVVVATDNTAGEKASSMRTLMKQYGINASFTSMVCDAPKRQVREGAPILPPSFAAAAAAASPAPSPRGAGGGGRAAAGDTEQQQQQQEHELAPREQNAEELRKNWNLVGAVEGCDCVIVDDIIDTGEKAEATAKDLKAGGARRIFMFASHGILSKGAVDRINNSPIEEVVVTNTVPVPSHIYCEKLVVLSVGKLLAEAIKRVHEDQSVSILCSSESNPRSS